MSNLALKINNLQKTYDNGVQALKGISLDIEKGDFFALLGANGAGKTTIIGIITDLVKKTGGEVEVFGNNIDNAFNEAKKYIGVVPQEFNFNIFEKVIDIVTQQAGYYGISRNIAKPRAVQILKDLGLGDKIDQVSRNLSGGMKRRLMIARALVHQPKLLILDEPTAGVDVELRKGMWEYLVDLNQNQGVTILLTTHYLEEVEQLCRNAAIIKEGKIIKQDSVKNLLKSLNNQTFIAEIVDPVPSDLSEKITDIGTDYASFKVVDEDLEIVLDKDKNMNTIFQLLDKKNIEIDSIRPKGNRLEELFLEVLNS